MDAVLRAAVDGGAVPNVVGVAADNEGVIYEGAAGPRAVGGDEPVGADSIFRIASITKIVYTAAALQQRERCNLNFDAPVDAYCPDFAAVQVLDGFDDDKPRMRPPASRATVKQLVTHTAGLAYSFWNGDIVRWEAAGGAANAPGGLKGSFAAPMVADPGTRLEYGISTDWLGRVVEAASRQSLACRSTPPRRCRCPSTSSERSTPRARVLAGLGGVAHAGEEWRTGSHNVTGRSIGMPVTSGTSS